MQALPANGSVSGLRVPDTAEVLKQIEEGGSSVTPRDVAMSIIERLQKNPANEYAEVAFLKEYVESPSFMKSIPLVLLTSLDSESGSGESTPDDFAISTMTGGTRGGVGPLSWVMDTQNMKRTGGGRHVRKMKTWSEEGTRKVDFDLGPEDGETTPTHHLRPMTQPALTVVNAEDDEDFFVEDDGSKANHSKTDVVEGSPLLLRPPMSTPVGVTQERRLEDACKQLHQRLRDKSPCVRAPQKLTVKGKVNFAVKNSYEEAQGKAKDGKTVSLSASDVVVTDLTSHHFEGLDDWDFNVFEECDLTQNRPLQSIAWECFMRHNLVDEFAIDKTKGMNFLMQTEAFYSPRTEVLYHNNVHAADVTQTVHSLIFSFGFGKFLNSLNKLSLLLSAIIHDMGHDGLNNAFHVARRDELALLYNDSSVLENYHLSQGSRLLFQKESTNFLMQLKQDEITQIRREMISSVMATDMATHMSHVNVYKGFVDKCGSNPEEWIDQGTSAIHETQAMILHAADVGTSSKPMAIADRWAELLREEFYRQGDEESKHSMPVSPLCDRRGKFAGSQAGFIQFIVLPVFSLLGQASPQVQRFIGEQIKANLRIWEDRKSLEGLEKTEVAEVSALPCVREVKRFLGRGRFGTVFGCALKEYEHEEVAIKVANCKAEDFPEARLIEHTDHPNVVRIIDVVCDSARGKAALVMEFCAGGTLHHLVHAAAAPNGDLQLSIAARLKCVLDVAKGLEHLHSHEVIHRDVKPTGCYLATPIQAFKLTASAHGSWGLPPVKLGDLVLARPLGTPNPMTAFAGTPTYMAPEILEGQDYGVKCDVYSAAILLHEVVSGKSPYEGSLDLKEPRSGLRIVAGERPPFDELPATPVHKETEELLSAAWCKAEDRILADQFRKRLSVALNLLLLQSGLEDASP